MAAVLSFKHWKAQKVTQAKSVVVQVRREMKSFSVLPPSLKARYKQALTNVSIAKELSPNDYFVLYIGPRFKGNTKAIAEATKGLSKEEIAEILVGYSDQLNEKPEVPRGRY
jgi:hypothetical protein